MNILKKAMAFVIGALLAGSLAACINFSGSYANADKYLVGTQYYDGELKTLDINWTQGKVTLIQDETTDHITVREDNDLPDGKKVHSWFNEGTLYIKFCQSGYIYTNVISADKQLYVTFPKLENLDLDVTSGSAVIEKIDAVKIDVSVTSGNVEIGEAIAETFTTKVTSGNVNLGDITADKFTCKVTSGKTTIDSLNTKEGTFNSTSGSIKANIPSAEKLEFHITSGNLDLTIPEAGATISLNKTSGKFSSTRAHTAENNTYVFGDGVCSIKIKITSGDVTIR